MRILHVTEAAASGTFEVVRALAAGCARAGHEVHVALGRRPETPGDLRAALPPGVHVHVLPWERRTPAAQVRAARALRDLARATAPDVVHLHSAFAGVVGAAALAGRRRAIYTPHASPVSRVDDGAPRRLVYGLAELAVARRCALVGAVSHAEADALRRRLPGVRVVAVPNGIDELDPGRTPAPASREGPRVVATGRIGPQRRPGETARILAGVRDRAAVEWIGGAPGGEDAPLRAAGIPVTGWLGREDALARLARATLCVHWSAWDGLSLSVLEALARDVVVVASDIPPNREVLGPAQVRGTSDEALALVRRALDDPATLAALLAGQRARRGAYGASRMVARWLEVYARAMR